MEQHGISSVIHPPGWTDFAPIFFLGVTLYAFIIFLALLHSAKTLIDDRNDRRRRKPTSKKKQRSSFLLTNWIHRTLKYVKSRREFMFSLRLVDLLQRVLICILYALNTYLQHIPVGTYYVQMLCGIAFGFKLFIEFFISEKGLYFVFDLGVLANCLSIPSLLLSTDNLWLNLNFLQALVLYNNIEQIIDEIAFAIYFSSISKLITKIFVQFFSFVYIVACGLQLFELLGDPSSRLKQNIFELSWINSLYFTVVTVMTVGYGDFVPYTLLGRITVIFVVVLGAIIVSRNVTNTVEVVTGLRRGRGSFMKKKGDRHVVVTGSIRWEHLEHFIYNFFSDDRNEKIHMIIMFSKQAWRDDEWSYFVATSNLQNSILYMEGDVMDRNDLRRAQVESAAAVFVLCEPHSSTPYIADSQTLRYILSVRTYSSDVLIYSLCATHESIFQMNFAVGKNQPVILQPKQQQYYEPHIDFFPVFKTDSIPSNSPRPQSPGSVSSRSSTASTLDDESSVDSSDSQAEQYRNSQALSLQNFHLSLLAESVFCNGISTLFTNLIFRTTHHVRRADKPWQVEYEIGAECKIEPALFPLALAGYKYAEILMHFYDYGLLVIGCQYPGSSKWRPITISDVVRAHSTGIFITYHDNEHFEKVLDFAAHKFIDTQTARVVTSTTLIPSDPRPPRQTRKMKKSFRSYSSSSAKDSPSSRTPVIVREESLSSSSNRLTVNLKEELANRPALNPKEELLISSEGTIGDKKHADPKTADEKRRKNVAREASNAIMGMGPKTESVLSLVNMDRPSKPTPSAPTVTEPENETIIFRNTPLPAHLHGHVVLCVIGNIESINLGIFLHKIWTKRKAHKIQKPVVVIHELFPDAYETIFKKYAGLLFFLEGNCLSIPVLKWAQVDKAIGITMVSSEKRENLQMMDAKTVYGLLTFDHLLPENSNTFICGTLDAEDTLHVFNAPLKNRRKGTQLGQIREAVVIRGRQDDSEEGNALAAAASLGTAKTKLKKVTLKLFEFPRLNIIDNNNKLTYKNLISDDDVYEKARFASGEVIISTVFFTTLIREFNNPGFLSFLKVILGIDQSYSYEKSKNSTCWIRLVDISPEWVEQAEFTGGRTYRDLFGHLMQNGCFPVGLYRSGDAPVRIEEKSTLWDRMSRKVHGTAKNRYRPFDDKRGDLNDSDSEQDPHVLESLQSRSRVGRKTENKTKTYTCPTTKRKVIFQELPQTGNVLPYVVTNPEPYTILAETDGVFVYCHPEQDLSTLFIS